jgi:hypothetical protein
VDLMSRAVLSLFLAAACATPLAAQSRRGAAAGEVAVRRAVETITEADVRGRIGVLADDSMRGRGTPSPELDKVAAYIASEFRRFGLRPGGDSGSFLQRYRIRRSQMDSASFVMAMGRGAHGHWALGREAVNTGGPLPAAALTAPIVLLVGIPADTARPFGDVSLRGAVVLHVLAATDVRSQALQPLIGRGQAEGVAGWILVTNRSAGAFASLLRFTMRPSLEVVGMAEDGGSAIPVFEVRDSSALGVLQAAGEDLAALRASGAAAIRALPGFTATLSARRTVLSEASAPNVVGILEGSDPQLKNEYVFFTAHMDHVGAVGMGNGCTAQGADSVCNGADDDASGAAGVVELAEAFATLNPRPRRSLVFMTVSGEERGLWGSQYFSEHPTVALADIVADLNMDMIGRNWRDTIVVIGKEHSSLGETANRVTGEHPELGMNLIDDLWPRENYYFRSDHYNFARKGVPILFFFNGVHPQYHRPSDAVDLIDAEKASRIARMVFYIGLDVANAAQRPQWNPESRRRIVGAAGN